MIPGVPSYDVDIYSDAVIQDPHPHYRALRDLGPVVWLPRNAVYAVPRYAEAAEALRNWRVFRSGLGISLDDRANALLVGSTVNSDPPAHDLTRSVTAAPLLPGALEVIRERIEAAANALVERLVARGSFDAVPDLAQVLPVTIVTELVGLPDAGRDKMLDWAAATFDLFGSANARSDAALHRLKDLRAFLDVNGRPEALTPGGWARRIFEVGPQRGLSLETCAQIMRDYINPSLDTTISATGYAIWLFAQNPAAWTRLRQEPALIPNAVEEVVRLATPIRAFSRFVAEDIEFGGARLPAGSRVLIIYASANRDERKWTDPDRFDPTRPVKDHLGFGSGIHMCMGMHLAKLEMTALLMALAARVEHFELTGPTRYVLNNTIHALATLPVRVHAARSIGPAAIPSSVPAAKRWLRVRVCARRQEAEDIVALDLVPADGEDALPPFAAGAHIDVRLPNGLVRQYSIASDPAQTHGYRLGILRAPLSRGGSRAVHEFAVEGSELHISTPRNAFALDEAAARTILVGGGIGLTPLLAMAYRLRDLGHPFELHVCTRSRGRTAFLADLAGFRPHLHLHHDDGPPAQRFDASAVLAGPAPGTHVYVCGPKGFMDYVTGTARAAGWTARNIHTEHFGAEIDTDGEAFTLHARRSGRSLEVKPGQTIADALAAAGIPVAMSCQSGVCGTCLTAVIEGTPDHRDLVQTEEEKAANTHITVCCSRSRTHTLTLDI